MKGVRERFSCLKIISVGNAGLHSSHEKQSSVQTLLNNESAILYPRFFFFPPLDIDVKTSKAHTPLGA